MKNCLHCGKEFVPDNNWRKLCSEECRIARRVEQFAKWHKENDGFTKPGGPRKNNGICVVCGGVAPKPKRGFAKTCPGKCRLTYKRMKSLEFRKASYEADPATAREKNRDYSRRRYQAKKSLQKPKSCPICSKTIVGTSQKLTCSDECKRKRERQQESGGVIGHNEDGGEFWRLVRCELSCQVCDGIFSGWERSGKWLCQPCKEYRKAARLEKAASIRVAKSAEARERKHIRMAETARREDARVRERLDGARREYRQLYLLHCAKCGGTFNAMDQRIKHCDLCCDPWYRVRKRMEKRRRYRKRQEENAHMQFVALQMHLAGRVENE